MQNTDTSTQVIIVGAGPTGLSMAVQLLRYSIDFIILERNEKTTNLSKAIVVQARTLEIFQEIGLAEKALKEGQITTALNLFYKGKPRAAVNFAGLGEGISPFPFALSLEQSKTEKLLIDYLIENGKRIHWKSELTHFEQRENGLTVYYKDGVQEQKIHAAYLVGCDGAGSLIRHQMDLPFKGDTVPKIFYVADVKLNSAVINKNELFIFLIKKGFILFFPMEGLGHYRIVGILPDVNDIDAIENFADIETGIKQQLISPVDFEEILWFSTYKVHSRMAASFAKERIFLAGDAAHIHTPAGGQGMNTGIQDAYNLAWKLAYVIRGEVRSTVLNTYNTERMENARHLLKTTDRMFDMMAGTTLFGNFVRIHLFPVLAGWITKSTLLKKRIFPLISQTGISYSKSCLTIDSFIGKVKAGIRMPYFIFCNGQSIYNYLTEPCFKILYFGKEDQDTHQLIRKIKFKISFWSFQEIPTSLFGLKKNFYILLRPDNHISYIGKSLANCLELFQM